MNKIVGTTLIELMLALLLSSMIFSGLTAIYLATQANYLAQSALMTIQENIRIAMHILNSSVRMAGYVGCAKLTADFPITHYSSFTLTPDNKVTAATSTEIMRNTDAITLRQAAILHATLMKTMLELGKLSVTSTPAFKSGSILIISDCETAEIFVAKQVLNLNDRTQIIMTEQPLKKYYAENAEVSHLEINTYYIGKTKRLDDNGASIQALYMKDINSRKTELIEGVNDMKIHYAIIEDGRLAEHNAAEIKDWSRIVGVAIELVFSSLNHFPLKKTEYIYATLR